jgi:hypothetical protein
MRAPNGTLLVMGMIDDRSSGRGFGARPELKQV